MSFGLNNTSLNLNLPHTSYDLNLELLLDPNSSSSSSSSPLIHVPEPPRVFTCNYCRRKFYSSQALGGHQNAHKLERTLAKKSRERSSVVRPHSGSAGRKQQQQQHSGSSGSRGSSNARCAQLQPPLAGLDHQEHDEIFNSSHEYGIMRRAHEDNYGSRDDHHEGDHWSTRGTYSGESVEEFSHLDLSLRL